LISVPDSLNSEEIKNNILMYKLNEQDEEKNHILFHIVRRNLAENLSINHYRTIDKNNFVYISKNPLSIKCYFFSYYKDALIFFPFLNDGYGFYIMDKNKLNNDSYIDVYLKNIFNIERITNEKQSSDVVNNFIKVFNEYSKPYRIITLIKSIKHLPKKLSKNDVKILVLISIFFISLFLIKIFPDIYENINVGATDPINSVFVVLGAIGGIITLISGINGAIKYIKTKRKHKNKEIK
jgi:hypothetical protein